MGTDKEEIKKNVKKLFEEYVNNGFIMHGEEKLSFEQLVKNIGTELNRCNLSRFDLGALLIELETSELYTWHQPRDKEQLGRITQLKKYFFGI